MITNSESGTRIDEIAAGIYRITVKDRSRHAPGLVQFVVKGRRSSYPLEASQLPLTGSLVLDPPTAETGQCGDAAFDGPEAACSADSSSVRCR